MLSRQDLESERLPEVIVVKGALQGAGATATAIDVPAEARAEVAAIAVAPAAAAAEVGAGADEVDVAAPEVHRGIGAVRHGATLVVTEVVGSAITEVEVVIVVGHMTVAGAIGETRVTPGLAVARHPPASPPTRRPRRPHRQTCLTSMPTSSPSGSLSSKTRSAPRDERHLSFYRMCRNVFTTTSKSQIFFPAM